MIDKYEVMRQANPVSLLDLCALLAGSQRIQLEFRDDTLFTGTRDEFYAWEEAEQYLDCEVQYMFPTSVYGLRVTILP